MEFSSQPQASAALTAEKSSRQPLNRRLGGARPRASRTFQRKHKYLSPVGIRTPDRPAHSLVTILTDLLWLSLPTISGTKHCASYNRQTALLWEIVALSAHWNVKQRTKYGIPWQENWNCCTKHDARYANNITRTRLRVNIFFFRGKAVSITYSEYASVA
jgi:hypothetical protein